MTALTSHYKMHLAKQGVDLKISYRSGTFFKVEKTKGKLTDSELKQIGRILPPKESDIQTYSEQFTDVTIVSITKQKTEFTKFTDAWFSFYETSVGFPPKFGAVDAAALKKIITHLNTIGGSQEEALGLWSTILAAYPKLSEFHRENLDLKYINSRLNVILNAVKKAISTGTSSSGRTDNSVSL